MSAVAPDSYARRRLLDLLGIERYVPREAAPAIREPVPTVREPALVVGKAIVGGASAPMLSGRQSGAAIGAEAPPTSRSIAISCDGDVARRHPKFIAHLARAIGIDAAAFTRRVDAAHTICFGATAPDASAMLAPPLATLRASPPAKRAFWRMLRDLRRILAGR